MSNSHPLRSTWTCTSVHVQRIPSNQDTMGTKRISFLPAGGGGSFWGQNLHRYMYLWITIVSCLLRFLQSFHVLLGGLPTCSTLLGGWDYQLGCGTSLLDPLCMHYTIVMVSTLWPAVLRECLCLLRCVLAGRADKSMSFHWEGSLRLSLMLTSVASLQRPALRYNYAIILSVYITTLVKWVKC